jgi:hypothetical protein
LNSDEIEGPVRYPVALADASRGRTEAELARHSRLRPIDSWTDNKNENQDPKTTIRKRLHLGRRDISRRECSDRRLSLAPALPHPSMEYPADGGHDAEMIQRRRSTFVRAAATMRGNKNQQIPEGDR